MNEQIKQLAEEAGFTFWGSPENGSGGRAARYDKELEKFAELIVKECARICVEDDFTMSNQGESSAQSFKDHFGVK